MSTEKNTQKPTLSRPDRKPANERYIARVRHMAQIIRSGYIAKSSDKEQSILKTFEKFKKGDA